MNETGSLCIIIVAFFMLVGSLVAAYIFGFREERQETFNPKTINENQTSSKSKLKYSCNKEAKDKLMPINDISLGNQHNPSTVLPRVMKPNYDVLKCDSEIDILATIKEAEDVSNEILPEQIGHEISTSRIESLKKPEIRTPGNIVPDDIRSQRPAEKLNNSSSETQGTSQSYISSSYTSDYWELTNNDVLKCDSEIDILATIKEAEDGSKEILPQQIGHEISHSRIESLKRNEIRTPGNIIPNDIRSQKPAEKLNNSSSETQGASQSDYTSDYWELTIEKDLKCKALQLPSTKPQRPPLPPRRSLQPQLYTYRAS